MVQQRITHSIALRAESTKMTPLLLLAMTPTGIPLRKIFPQTMLSPRPVLYCRLYSLK